MEQGKHLLFYRQQQRGDVVVSRIPSEHVAGKTGCPSVTARLLLHGLTEEQVPRCLAFMRKKRMMGCILPGRRKLLQSRAIGNFPARCLPDLPIIPFAGSPCWIRIRRARTLFRTAAGLCDAFSTERGDERVASALIPAPPQSLTSPP